MVQQYGWISSRDPLNDFPPASTWSPPTSTCSQMQRKASSITCNNPFKAGTPARPISAWHCGIMTHCVHRKLEHHHALVNRWKALPASWELATNTVIYCPDWDDFERLVLLSSAHFTGTDVEAERGDRGRGRAWNRTQIFLLPASLLLSGLFTTGPHTPWGTGCSSLEHHQTQGSAHQESARVNLDF